MSLKLTIRHYYDFGADRSVVGADLVTPESWDGLRTGTSGPFAIPETREAFADAAARRPEIAARASAVDTWLEAHGAGAVASYGVGGAQLEWWLHRQRPKRELVLADYGTATIDRLNEVFPHAETRHHDLRRDGPLSADVHLFHRIDTELSDREWRDVYERFDSVPVLVIATQVLDAWHVMLELAQRPVLKVRRASAAGFSRTAAAFESLWQATHSAEAQLMHDLHAWWLTPRDRR